MRISLIRNQLSLYVPEPEARAIESARRVLDPIQRSLIPAHVTLCREDELAQLEPGVRESRLADSLAGPLTLHFGKAEPFHGHGILLPCTGGEADFHSLRERLLGSREIRRLAPHITLAHPRNPKAAGNALSTAFMLPERITVTFRSVNLIEQAGASAWRVVDTFGLPQASGSARQDDHSARSAP